MRNAAPSPRTVFGIVLLAASVITLPALAAFMKHTIDATTLIVRFVIAIAVCGIAARMMMAFVRSMSTHARVVAKDEDESVSAGSQMPGMAGGVAAAEAAATQPTPEPGLVGEPEH